MKKTVKLISLVLALLLASLALFSCKEPEPEAKSIWDSATYTSDTALGEGAKTIAVTVEAEEKSVVITVKTDRDNVADALREIGLIDGEDSGSYGFTVYTVNGILADFNTSGAYWAFYVNGEYSLVGASFIEVKDGDNIKIKYDKF